MSGRTSRLGSTLPSVEITRKGLKFRESHDLVSAAPTNCNWMDAAGINESCGLSQISIRPLLSLIISEDKHACRGMFPCRWLQSTLYVCSSKLICPDETLDEAN